MSTQIIENRTIHHRDDINRDQVWSADSVHVIANPISVRRSILRIGPGTIVKFAQDAALSIMDSAGIIADGTQKTITFTSDIAENGSWKYLYFSDRAVHDSCRLIRCNFEYGGGDSSRGGIIFCDGASPTIRACTIAKSKSSGVVFLGDCRGCQFDSNLVANCDFVPIQTYPANVSLLDGNFFQENGLNQIRIIHRLIDYRDTWKNLSLPYRMADGLEINGGSLVLEPGVELIFEQNEGAIITETGALQANGNATNRVIFTGSGGRGWNGIYFTASADHQNSRFFHSVIEYGGADDSHPANVTLEDGLPAFSDCIIQLSQGYGIYISGRMASNTFANNIITRNSLAPINLPAHAVPVLAGGDYLGNESDAIEVRGGTMDGLVTQDGYWQNLGVPYLVENTIEINSGKITFAPGVKIEMSDRSRFIVRNGGGFMANGTFAPIEITGARSVIGTWNNIYFSPTASAINCQLINCTISYGGGDASQPGMIFCDNVTPTIKNCFIEYSQTWGIYLNGNASILDLASNFFQGNVYGDYYQKP